MTWTKTEIDEAIAELELDLAAYKSALDVIVRRRQEAEQTKYGEFFTQSSGCLATLHLLIMNVSSTEGMIEDMKENKEKLPEDRPVLQLVKNEVGNV